ncbi:MAG: 50S ribosomal protein L19 [Candidatus Nealsonbacteria bacterium]|nr:50S ribosomal protein L19 [Candidatus Nealsonbacteria bacterium]
MPTKIETFIKTQLRSDLPDIRPGDSVKIYQKIPASAGATAGKKEGEKIQVFEGLIIAKKHGKGITSTITVRKVVSGIGVEKIIPIHSPAIEKIEIVKRGKTRRAKLYYLRTAKGKRARLKKKEFAEAIAEEPIKEEPIEIKPQS